MAASAAVKDAFTFVGGLNTEGGYFIVPENSYKEGVNVVPQSDGTLERRNGIDYEVAYQLYAAAVTPDQRNLWAFGTGIWTTVGGDGNLDYIVAQVGATLHFYKSATASISGNKKSFTVNLSTYKLSASTATTGVDGCTFTSVSGRLIVTCAQCYPILIEYNVATDTITTSTITIATRDYVGIPLIDTATNLEVAIDLEYDAAGWATLGVDTADVEYNLLNQGWTADTITTYKTANSGKWPANTKSWIYGKDTSDVFDASLLNKQLFGNSPAPKGHYVLTPLTALTTTVKVCAFFAGRAWFAGSQDPEYLGTVFFSQVVDVGEKIGLCHQVNDPTSEVISEIQDSDGGTIQIPDAGEIVGLQAADKGLLVFGTNGVWFISGLDSAFSASNYAVEKISDVGCLNRKTITQIDSGIVYWSTTGIYVLSKTPTGGWQTQNVSDKNIKSFFNDIPTIGKLYAEAAYNRNLQIIYWLYSDTEAVSSSEGKYNKNAILAFDMRLTSWYWFSLDETVGVIPVSIGVSRETNAASEAYDVIAGTDDVLVGTDNLVAELNVIGAGVKQFKLFCLHPATASTYSLTWADFNNTRSASTKFQDWYTADTIGADSPAYFTTGYNLGSNGPARAKTGAYLTTFLKRTETAFDVNSNPVNPSSCLMEARWDFTDNGYAGKWAPAVQVYKHLRPFFALGPSTYDDSYSLVITKNKLRGRGKAVQFKFSSEAGNDMKIVGWSGTFVGNQNV